LSLHGLLALHLRTLRILPRLCLFPAPLVVGALPRLLSLCSLLSLRLIALRILA